MSIANTPLQGFDLLNKVSSLRAFLPAMSWIHGPAFSSPCIQDVTAAFGGLQFPMVNIQQKVDISWLTDMSYDTSKIKEALQETHFQMNEKGAAAQSAATVALVTCIAPPKPLFTIDKPFYLWIERPGMSIPLFTAYIDQSDWKMPGKLD